MKGRISVAACAAMLLGACAGDPSGPARPELAGTYVLTELRFDPQGVLPEADVAARLDVTDVQLVLVPDGRAQLRYVDPGTGLLTATDAVWSTPTGGVRVHFVDGTGHRAVLLPPRITFDEVPGTGALRFDDETLDAVPRSRLLELVPEWSGEQLLDPVPGRLIVEFERAAAGAAEAAEP